ncbi:MAG TPA: alkaline phosphatase family protein [Polyangiaceae bacterium]|jgi:phospholipase C
MAFRRAPASLSAIALSAWLAACGGKTTEDPSTPFPGVGTLSDGTSACGYIDATARARAACNFRAGARVVDTLGDVEMARKAIAHIIVVVHENHSFDNIFGVTGHGLEGLPAGSSNPGDPEPISSFHETNLCTADVEHTFAAMHDEYDYGRMDGFARTVGRTAMGYYDDADHPFFTWAATTFASSDRHFGSALAPTWPNRDYLFAGTSDGIEETGELGFSAPTVFDELNAAHVAWADYSNGATPVLQTDLGWKTVPHQVKPYAEFAGALASGQLEPVVFIDSGEDTHDEHPGFDGIDQGERFVATLLAEAFTSPLWGGLAIVFTYDESGGFYDHVPPPSACVAAPSQTHFDRLGFRIPLIVISAHARAGYVSHQVHSQTSILRLIEALFDLPALTARDANSDALLDLFDFCDSPFATPPTNVPAPTAVVSTCP